MRIVVITSSYPQFDGDASGHFVRSDVLSLVDAGHDVTVLAPHPRPHELAGPPRVCFQPGGSAFGWPGMRPRISACPTRVTWVAAFVLACRRHLARHNYDRVIAHWLFPAGIPIASACAAPREFVLHGSDARWVLSWPAWLRRRLSRHLLEQGSTLRFVSERLREEFLEATDPQLRKLSTVLPCQVYTPTYDRGQVRARLGIAAETRVALVVGRLLASKRVDLALNAELPDHEWIVIGDGPERAHLQARHPHVRFLGRLPRETTLRWLAAADVLVSASLLEGCPTVIREARQLGTPVLTAPAGDVGQWAEQDPGIQVVRAWGSP